LATANANGSRLAIADCDLHLGPRSLDELRPFLPSRVLRYVETDPSHALPQVDVARRQQAFHDNAFALYGT
jgi:hypothetical protein